MTKRFLILITFFSCITSCFGVSYVLNDSPYFIDETIHVLGHELIIIEPGVTLFLAPGVDILIEGKAFISGTVNNPVNFLPQIEEVGWGKLYFQNENFLYHMRHVYLEDGVLWSENANLNLSFVEINTSQDLTWETPVVFLKYGSSKIDNCYFHGIDKGEGIQLLEQNGVHVTNCIISALPDAIELTSINGGVIKNNVISNMSDDAIDLNNSNDINISGNIISGAQDRGMEIGSEDNGSSSNITIRSNTISRCAEGITVKEGSDAAIINNTFYSNDIAILSLELVPGTGGSTVNIVNSIFFESTTMDVFSDASSTINLKYCSSNLNILEGEGNMLFDPLLSDPEDENFHLLPFSPAIDAGDPGSVSDLDGTQSDLGAYYFDQCNGQCVNKAIESLIYPNPFKKNLTIEIRLEHDMQLKISLYSLEGRLITSLMDQFECAGVYRFNFDGNTIEAGAYLVKIWSKDQFTTHKVVKL